MNRDLWVAVLLFVSGALSLATRMLPVSDQLLPYLIYVSALINLALTIFFGYSGVKTLRAKNGNGSVKATK